MKESFSNTVFETFLSRLHTTSPTLTEATMRKIASDLRDEAMTLLLQNGKYLRDLIANAVMEKEHSNLEFKKFVDQIIDQSKKVTNIMIKDGVVVAEHDNVKGIKVMKARSTVLQETVHFMNYLNEKVYDFYKDIFKLEQKEVEQQGKLF
jgi:glycine/serine hydroxymethyltransferase